MDFLKEWTFCVCCSLVAAVILSLLAPSGKMNRFYKMLTGLFVFLSFLYPFRDWQGLRLTFPTAAPMAEAETMSDNVYRQTAERELKTFLADNGIVGAAVSCDVEVDYDSGEIRLNGVQIAVPDEYDIDSVSRLIQDRLGVKARVISLGE